MQEADLVHVLNSAENLFADAQRRAEREALFALSAPEFGQVLALQGHDQEVELVRGAAADVLAHVVAALQASQHGHFHLEHLFGLLDRFDFESHVLLGEQIDAFIDLAESTATDFAQYSPTLFNDIIGHEQIDFRRHFLLFVVPFGVCLLSF